MLELIREKRKVFELEISKIGKFILKNKKKIRIIDKKKFQTNLDIKINKRIKKLITKFFPNKKILSEEDKIYKIPNSEYWLVDPIDGTRSLYDGYKTYGIQFCYVINQRPVYSVINLPEINKNISSLLKDGVRINGKKFNKKNNLRAQILVDNNKFPIKECKVIMKSCNIRRYIEAGSFAYKSMLIALNEATLFFKNVKFYAWDIFPQLLINNELGNYTFDLKGKKFDIINKLIYSNGLIVTSKKQNIKKITKIIR
jgi:3'(2'), 5'-bisphosphate nucleotidase